MTNIRLLRQHELLTRMLRLACEQGDALVEERLDQFFLLMDERERIAADLDINEDAPSPSNVVLFPTISRVGSEADLKAAVSALIVSVLAQDEENERLLRSQMDELLLAQSRVLKGYSAARGYAAAVPQEQLGRRLNVAY